MTSPKVIYKEEVSVVAIPKSCTIVAQYSCEGNHCLVVKGHPDCSSDCIQIHNLIEGFGGRMLIGDTVKHLGDIPLTAIGILPYVRDFISHG